MKTLENDFYSTHNWQVCRTCKTEWIYVDKNHGWCILCYQDQRLKTLREQELDIGRWQANENIPKKQDIAIIDHSKCVSCGKDIQNNDKVAKLCNNCLSTQIARNGTLVYRLGMYNEAIRKEKVKIMEERQEAGKEKLEDWKITPRK